MIIKSLNTSTWLRRGVGVVARVKRTPEIPQGTDVLQLHMVAKAPLTTLEVLKMGAIR